MSKEQELLVEGDDQLNLSTGYFTRKSFKVGAPEVEKYEETVTQLIKDTKQIINGREWFLTTMTLPGGILFPDGEVNDYSWVVAPIIHIDKGEQSQYPIPESPGDHYETRVAVEDAKKFNDFKEALLALGML